MASLDPDRLSRFNGTLRRDAADTARRRLSDLLALMFQGREVAARLGGVRTQPLLSVPPTHPG